MQILGISGSLRKASFNTGLLRAAATMLPGGHHLTIADISRLPLLNEDLEVGGRGPEVVEALRAEIQAADALLIASTEYNYGMSAPLKNAIDWASRPFPKDRPQGSEAPEGGGVYTVPKCPLTGKPVAITGRQRRHWRHDPFATVLTPGAADQLGLAVAAARSFRDLRLFRQVRGHDRRPHGQ